MNKNDKNNIEEYNIEEYNELSYNKLNKIFDILKLDKSNKYSWDISNDKTLKITGYFDRTFSHNQNLKKTEDDKMIVEISFGSMIYSDEINIIIIKKEEFGTYLQRLLSTNSIYEQRKLLVKNDTEKTKITKNDFLNEYKKGQQDVIGYISSKTAKRNKELNLLTSNDIYKIDLDDAILYSSSQGCSVVQGICESFSFENILNQIDSIYYSTTFTTDNDVKDDKQMFKDCELSFDKLNDILSDDSYYFDKLIVFYSGNNIVAILTDYNLDPEINSLESFKEKFNRYIFKKQTNNLITSEEEECKCSYCSCNNCYNISSSCDLEDTDCPKNVDEHNEKVLEDQDLFFKVSGYIACISLNDLKNMVKIGLTDNNIFEELYVPSLANILYARIDFMPNQVETFVPISKYSKNNSIEEIVKLYDENPKEKIIIHCLNDKNKVFAIISNASKDEVNFYELQE